MISTKNFLHDILLEILSLREKNDFDAFMDKLYEAISGEFSDAFAGASPIRDQQLAFSVMIEHFQKKEEFEKCALLNDFADGITNESR